MIEHYARIAQDNRVDVLVVGSELVSSESEEHLDEWTQTIRDVRNIYKGQLTYSSNWDRYWKVPFWKYLDFIGMNSYWTLGKNRDASVDQINDEWRKIQKRMFEFQDQTHKPVILLEAAGAAWPTPPRTPGITRRTSLPPTTIYRKNCTRRFSKAGGASRSWPE